MLRAFRVNEFPSAGNDDKVNNSITAWVAVKKKKKFQTSLKLRHRSDQTGILTYHWVAEVAQPLLSGIYWKPMNKKLNSPHPIYCIFIFHSNHLTIYPFIFQSLTSVYLKFWRAFNLKWSQEVMICIYSVNAVTCRRTSVYPKVWQYYQHQLITDGSSLLWISFREI